MDGTDRAPGVRGPVRARPVMTYLLIGSCCLIFLIGPASGFTSSYGTGEELRAAQAEYFRRWGVVPRTLLSGAAEPLLTPLTALFLHGNWLHLLGNLLFLYVFGGMVEQRLGPSRFALSYLCVGYLAMLCYAASHPDSPETLVGASGAISGVLGAFLYLFPRTRVTSVFPFLFFLPLRFPAWSVLLFWLTLQWLAVREDDDGPGVAYLAHVVGFTLGFLYAWIRFRRARVTGPAPPPEGEIRP
ncbi:rhomboid family intramembrane serine protease [Streptomyces boncukensis]|uniref:Rhomboid family intramembrane serine protease n=1 Tax=Streptomyces boncukensis TaxID=2711219 RepID=A0A6G4WSM0_9ACTN|nr:rhomboid family intramembrane serine protease [Streptomyces boncukensis]NGO68108.1 rhomboid family intramembrane serine protease [Streptomyces boncukensis]